MDYTYSFKFEYREKEDSSYKTEQFIFCSREKDIEEACTIAMLMYLKKHDYYSGKLVSMARHFD